MLPNPLDLVNLGEQNLLWRGVLAELAPGLATREFAHERNFGLSPLALLMFLLGTAAATRRVFSPERSERDVVALVSGLAALLFLALLVRIGDVSGWLLVYHVVPGARVVMAASRALTVILIPVLLVAVVGLDQWARQPGRSRGRAVVLAAVASLLLVESIDLAPVSGLSRRFERAERARVERPPEGCRSFYILPGGVDAHAAIA